MAPSRRWIRLDAEWEESGWLDALSGQAAGCWPRLLCWVKLRGKGGRCKAPDLGVLARRWRVPQEAVAELLAAARSDEAVVMEGDELVVTNWEEYQEPDPTAAERKRRQREREVPTPSTSPNGSHGNVTDVTRDIPGQGGVTPSRGRDPSRDPRQGERQGVSSGRSHLPEKSNSPDAEETRATGPSSPPPELLALLEDFPDAIEVVMAMNHLGSVMATTTALRLCFLYENEGKATPDDSMKGKGFAERQRLTARALVEMQAKGVRTWSSAALSGFVGNLLASPAPRVRTPDFGNESRRDSSRAEEAARRQTQRALEEREAKEEAAEVATRESWEWFEMLSPEVKAELEAECRERTKKLGKLSADVARGILLGIIAEKRKQEAAA